MSIKLFISEQIIISILIFVLTSYSFSQTDYNCEQALQQLIVKIESEYHVFNDKTKDIILLK